MTILEFSIIILVCLILILLWFVNRLKLKREMKMLDESRRKVIEAISKLEDEKLWDLEMQRLEKEIRKGKIIHDNSIILATSDDGIVFMTRADMLPILSIDTIEWQFKDWVI